MVPNSYSSSDLRALVRRLRPVDPARRFARPVPPRPFFVPTRPFGPRVFHLYDPTQEDDSANSLNSATISW